MRITNNRTATSAPFGFVVIGYNISLADKAIFMKRGNKYAGLLVTVYRIIADTNLALLFGIDRVGGARINSNAHRVVTYFVVFDLWIRLFPDAYAHIVIVYGVPPEGWLGKAADANTCYLIIVYFIVIDLPIGAQAVTDADPVIKDEIIVDLGLFCKAFMAMDADPHMFIAANFIIENLWTGVQDLQAVTEDARSSPVTTKPSIFPEVILSR